MIAQEKAKSVEIDTLDCPRCSEPVFVADPDGTYSEDDEGTCSECGLFCWVSIEDEFASIESEQTPDTSPSA